MFEVKAKATLGDDSTVEITFNINIGDNLQEAVERNGEALVFERFKRACIIEAQSRARGLAASGKSVEEVAMFMEENWVPGATVANPEASILQNFSKLSAEEQQAMMARLKESLGL